MNPEKAVIFFISGLSQYQSLIFQVLYFCQGNRPKICIRFSGQVYSMWPDCIILLDPKYWCLYTISHAVTSQADWLLFQYHWDVDCSIFPSQLYNMAKCIHMVQVLARCRNIYEAISGMLFKKWIDVIRYKNWSEKKKYYWRNRILFLKIKSTACLTYDAKDTFDNTYNRAILEHIVRLNSQTI